MSISKKPKKQTARMGKTVVASMNRKNYGEEYEFDHPISHHEASIAFTWYSMNCDRKQATRFVLDYLESQNRFDDIKIVKSVSDSKVKATVATGCWIARMLSNGTVFIDNDFYVNIFENGIKDLVIKSNNGEDDIIEDEDGNIKVISKGKPAEPVKKFQRISATRSPREKQFDRYLELLNEVADAIDLTLIGKPNYKYTIIDTLRNEKVDPIHVKDMMDELLENEAEIKYALSGDYEEFNERFSGRKNEMMKKQAFVATLINELNTYLSTDGKKTNKTKVDVSGNIVEKIRKPRKKKPVSASKLISKIKYQEADDLLGLKSIDPLKIVGAQELWAYNTKYASLTVYKSMGEAGLSMKGTTLLNFDETTSVSKKIGRKAKEHTNAVLMAGKVQLRKYIDTINATATKPNGRINENTILLRVING